MSGHASDRRTGYRDGYASGFSDGVHLGRCEGIIRRTLAIPPRKDVKVLYVTSGLWAYRPLDEGIAEALSELTTECQIVQPTEDIPEISSRYRPDLVLSLNSVQCMKTEHADAVRGMGIRTAVWFSDDPYYFDVTAGIAPHYDYVFTLESVCVPLYREAGCDNVYHLPFAAHAKLFRPKRVDPSQRTDICFIGSAFRNRVAFFDEIAGYLAGKNTLISGYWWERLSNYRLLGPNIRSGYWMSPEDTASYYNGAKIVINFHRAVDEETNQNAGLVPARSVNPRTFEIAACGTLQLTDLREDLHTHFTPGTEIATYSSPGELAERIEYYLTHEEERRAVAARSLERVMREHTYYHRLDTLLRTVFGG
ncbi:glycosyltransferase [Paenibacillus tarimensis]